MSLNYSLFYCRSLLSRFFARGVCTNLIALSSAVLPQKSLIIDMDLFLPSSTFISWSVFYCSAAGDFGLRDRYSEGIRASFAYIVAFFEGKTELLESKKGCLCVDLFWERLLLLLPGDSGDSLLSRIYLEVRLVSRKIFLICLFITSCSSKITAFFFSTASKERPYILRSAITDDIIFVIALFSPQLFFFRLFSFCSSSCSRWILSIASRTQGSGCTWVDSTRLTEAGSSTLLYDFPFFLPFVVVDFFLAIWRSSTERPTIWALFAMCLWFSLIIFLLKADDMASVIMLLPCSAICKCMGVLTRWSDFCP